MSRVRTHFCTLVARGYGAGSRPVRYGMNGTMPATVNSSDGSGEISEALGTTVWPRAAKCSRNRRRISAVCMYLLGSAGRRRSVVSSWPPARGSVVGGVGAVPAGQPDLVTRGERCVQAGARAELRLTLGRGGADVGSEVTDRLGEVAEAVGDRPAD